MMRMMVRVKIIRRRPIPLPSVGVWSFSMWNPSNLLLILLIWLFCVWDASLSSNSAAFDDDPPIVIIALSVMYLSVCWMISYCRFVCWGPLKWILSLWHGALGWSNIFWCVGIFRNCCVPMDVLKKSVGADVLSPVFGFYNVQHEIWPDFQYCDWSWPPFADVILHQHLVAGWKMDGDLVPLLAYFICIICILSVFHELCMIFAYLAREDAVFALIWKIFTPVMIHRLWPCYAMLPAPQLCFC